MDPSKYLVLQNMKPKSRPSLQVVKEVETKRIIVIKKYGNELTQDQLTTQIQRVSKWRKIVSKSIQYCSPLPTSENVNLSLTMDYMPRGSIKRQLKHGRITFEQKMKISFYLANALLSLHANGFIHGNICPSNVLLDSRYEPKLSDFLPDLAMNCKHTNYVATELISNKISEPNKQTDIYSYGKVLKFIFEKDMKENNNNLPPLFIQLMNNAAAEQPDKRPSAEDIVETFIRNGAFIKLDNSTPIYSPLYDLNEYLSKKPTEDQQQQQQPSDEQKQDNGEEPKEEKQEDEQKPQENEETQEKPKEEKQENNPDTNEDKLDFTIDIDTLTDEITMYKYAVHFYSDFQEYHSFSKAIQLLTKTSTSFPCSGFSLALLLSDGTIIQQDLLRAADLFRNIEAQIPEANVKLGKLLMSNMIGEKEEKECIHVLTTAADKGISEANFLLGNIYEYGLVQCEKDLEQASHYYHLAAMKGHTEAQLKYGTLLHNGFGVNKNIEEAASIYKEAAKNGDPVAMTQYALFLRNGIGVEKNMKEAAQLLKKAAEKDNPDAQNTYGIILKNGDGVTRNIRLSAKYLEKAATSGNVAAQNNYAWMLKNGCGVQKNVEKAAEYYKLASESGSPVGATNYGLALLDGIGVPKSEKLAAQQFKKAADGNDPFGMLNYAISLYDGVGVKQNYKEAAKYYKQAADMGNVTAQFQYARMLKDGVGIEKDFPEAAKYFKLAADQGHPDARFEYGSLLKNGTGIPKNEEEAAKYLTFNATNGNFFSSGSKGRAASKMSESDATPSNMPTMYSNDAGNSGLNMNLNEIMNKINLGIDNEEAMKYMKMAADQGNVSAMIEYAKLCGNEEEELRYLQMAADLGSVEAQIALGLKQFKKNNEEEDHEEEVLAPEIELPQEVEGLENSPEEDIVDEFSQGSEIVSREINFDDLLSKEVDPSKTVKFAKSEGQFTLAEENARRSEQLNRYANMSSQERINLRSAEAIALFRQSSDLGDPEGHYQLGLCYENGLGIPEDQVKAKEEFHTAADLGHTKGAYKYGEYASKDGNEEEALQYYMQAAKENHNKAKLQAALILEKDVFHFPSLMQAASYFRELSVIGYGEAMYHYAVMLRDGLGVPIDYPRSAHYFLRAAQLNYLDSGLQYGLLLIGDKNIEFMITSVKQYFLLAIKEQQTEFGYFLLGLFMVTGIGMKRDIQRAITALQFCKDNEQAQIIIKMCQERNNDVVFVALRNLADAGCIEAMHKIALIYKREKDEANFIKYIKKAADNDFMPSQYEYGVALFTGYGCEQNLRDGTNRITKAADNKIVDAMFFIGKERERGIHIEKDIDEAIKYYKNAIELNSAKAMFRFGMLHILNGMPDAKPLEGVGYIIKAMQVNEEETAIEYATMLHEGDLVEVDDERAKGLLQTYADRGCKQAVLKYIEFYGEYRPTEGQGLPLYTMKSSSELIFSFLMPKATDSSPLSQETSQNTSQNDLIKGEK